ncbi:hypothetical protein DL765_006880 [Monosporascus sp. GIB2]|nr:hypothetical protein DL765_006880 [Monosporascus sp. GIB2]
MQQNQDAPKAYPGEYSTDLVTAASLGFLDEAIPEGKPFFLGVAPIGPHSETIKGQFNPAVPADRHKDLFPGLKVPRTANFNPDTASGASWIKTLQKLNQTVVDYLDKFYRLRILSLQAVDELVNSIVKRLEKSPEVLENTYIIYTTDNGFHVGQHRLAPGKTCPIEEDLNIPFIIRGPGVEKGKTVSVPTSHTDIAPTIFELAGIPLQDDFDGLPMPVTKAQQEAVKVYKTEHVNIEFWGKSLFEGGFPGDGSGVVKGSGVNNTYKSLRVISEGYDLAYTVWCSNEHELYEMKSDPGQMVNLYETSSRGNSSIYGWEAQRLISRLDALLLTLKTCKGASCRRPWSTLHPIGDVLSLEQAMDPKFDEFYAEGQNKVSFSACVGGFITDYEGVMESKPFSEEYYGDPPGGKAKEDDPLCEDCAKLDLEKSLASAFALYEGARRGINFRQLGVYRRGDGPVYLKDFYHVASLGDRLSRETSSCKLCAFLASTTAERDTGGTTHKLLAFCSSESYLFEAARRDGRGRLVRRRGWDALDHNVFMAVAPEDPLVPKTAPKADFTLTRAWLDRCRGSHDFCKPRKPAGATLRGFRVIDCQAFAPRVEERPWSERYVALSYVWGPSTEEWPRTVLDAVEVTRRLGERYLWVDRLCIGQTNEDETRFLFSKMNLIYEGVAFAIVGAAGDARTGLPGVTRKQRKPQPRVELDRPTRRSRDTNAGSSAQPDPDPGLELVGVPLEEYEREPAGEQGWLDTHHHGLRSGLALDMSELMKDQELMDKYDIPSEHLRLFQDLADDFSLTIENFLEIQKAVALRKGIPLKEMVSYLQGRAASRRARGEGSNGGPSLPPAPIIPERPLTSSSKPWKPLPPSRVQGKTILVSSMQEPRVTIRNSEWTTRGWTYQEGVLSKRRLVFTEEQIYWECCGMALDETLDLHPGIVQAEPGAPMPDYMLSGIFEGDVHRVPELQYGFQPRRHEEGGQSVQKLDSHIRAYTSRKLTNSGDSLNAFLGVAAHYSDESGLSLLLGIPIWAGLFGDGKPGLQHTFALSISGWMHSAKRIADGAEMYVASCPRREKFPSWTWAGWQGMTTFSESDASSAGGGGGEEQDDDEAADTEYSDFFMALTSEQWVSSVDKIWSAEMMLHDASGTEATLLTGRVPVSSTGDPNRRWLLTIRKPLVLRHMYLMHSVNEWEWRQLMGKRARIHLSVPMTEAALAAGHKTGELVTVLVFASTVPFIYTGCARFLILRRTDAGGGRWERIGRLTLTLEEWMMDKYGDTKKLLDDLPVRSFGKETILV